ncbi:thiopeptide-type bacteriocin biosynthesis protein [Nonomuraea sp. K274]|uniref:Thiopeptide-type bacteriocin biosynthesis protein n=1 Tax=Nonomuraea cypriaca TaxID=1187855 RepID=A0A931F0M1_9ACTN|nr:thiopeptide-type bacteriocin biosynthesis protein [Nonomuraea cypriaca]MBF8191029.1 thiopeptide-type bacteriocin biosynthesis protein [Nonomuraea cypriaca]
MEETDWLSAHVFYQGDQDHLLVHAVLPLVSELPVAGWFFLRYWDGGPHVRLRVLPAPGADAAGLSAAIEARFTGYFSSHPSTPLMRAEEYAETAELLARWESIRPAFAELQPNDSLAFVPYRREHHRYGHGAAIEAVERHFTDSSELALRLLGSGASDGQRSTAALAMLMLAWLTCEPDPARLLSWISHESRQYGAQPWPEPDLGDQRDTAVAIARRMAAMAAAGSRLGGSGTLIEWARSIRALRDVLRTESAKGSLLPPGSGWEGPGGIVSGDASVLTIIDICAHLACNRLGVTLPGEIAVRRLAGDALAALADDRS